MKLNFRSAVIFVKDIEVSKNFYTEILGQEISEDYGENVGFKSGFAIWQAEHAQRIIKQSDMSVSGGGTPGSDNMELYFETENIYEVGQKLEALDIQLIHPIKKEPWGQKTIRFYDPDMHIIEVGEVMEMLLGSEK